MKKQMFKRFGLWLMLALCLPLGMSLLVGCTPDGGLPETDPDTDPPTDAPTDTPVDTPAETPTEEPTDDATDAPTEEPTEEPTEPVCEGETDPDAPPVRTQAIPCDNIALNAFLIHMTNPEQRQEMMRLCAEADIDILSHPLPVFSWPYDSTPNTQAWLKATMA